MLSTQDKKTCHAIAEVLWDIGIGKDPGTLPADLLLRLDVLLPTVTEDRVRTQLQQNRARLERYIKIAELKARIAALTNELAKAEQPPLNLTDFKYGSKGLRDALNS